MLLLTHWHIYNTQFGAEEHTQASTRKKTKDTHSQQIHILVHNDITEIHCVTLQEKKYLQ